MNLNERLDYLNGMLFALDGSWSKISAEIQDRIDGLTLKLISENDEQTRGAIKALRDLKDLQKTVEYELEHIKQALEEQEAT